MTTSNFQRFGKRGVLTPATPVLGSNARTWEHALVNTFASRIEEQQARAVVRGYSYAKSVKNVEENNIKSQDLGSHTAYAVGHETFMRIDTRNISGAIKVSGKGVIKGIYRAVRSKSNF